MLPATNVILRDVPLEEPGTEPVEQTVSLPAERLLREKERIREELVREDRVSWPPIPPGASSGSSQQIQRDGAFTTCYISPGPFGTTNAPPGEDEEQGTPGEAGIIGSQGPPGSQGLVGVRGVTGIKGTAGFGVDCYEPIDPTNPFAIKREGEIWDQVLFSGIDETEQVCLPGTFISSELSGAELSIHAVAMGHETDVQETDGFGNGTILIGPFSNAIGNRFEDPVGPPVEGVIAIGKFAGWSQGQRSGAVAIGHNAAGSSEVSAEPPGEEDPKPQGTAALAIGFQAGWGAQRGLGEDIDGGDNTNRTGQDADAIAIGERAAVYGQGEGAIAIGQAAAAAFAIGMNGTQPVLPGQNYPSWTQSTGSIAIGGSAGRSGQQVGAIAIGYAAGSMPATFRNIDAEGSVIIQPSIKGTFPWASGAVEPVPASEVNYDAYQQQLYAVAIGAAAGRTQLEVEQNDNIFEAGGQPEKSIAIGANALSSWAKIVDALAGHQGAGFTLPNSRFYRGDSQIAIGYNAANAGQWGGGTRGSSIDPGAAFYGAGIGIGAYAGAHWSRYLVTQGWSPGQPTWWEGIIRGNPIVSDLDFWAQRPGSIIIGPGAGLVAYANDQKFQVYNPDDGAICIGDRAALVSFEAGALGHQRGQTDIISIGFGAGIDASARAISIGSVAISGSLGLKCAAGACPTGFGMIGADSVGIGANTELGMGASSVWSTGWVRGEKSTRIGVSGLYGTALDTSGSTSDQSVLIGIGTTRPHSSASAPTFSGHGSVCISNCQNFDRLLFSATGVALARTAGVSGPHDVNTPPGTWDYALAVGSGGGMSSQLNPAQQQALAVQGLVSQAEGVQLMPNYSLSPGVVVNGPLPNLGVWTSVEQGFYVGAPASSTVITKATFPSTHFTEYTPASGEIRRRRIEDIALEGLILTDDLSVTSGADLLNATLFKGATVTINAPMTFSDGSSLIGGTLDISGGVVQTGSISADSAWVKTTLTSDKIIARHMQFVDAEVDNLTVTQGFLIGSQGTNVTEPTALFDISSTALMEGGITLTGGIFISSASQGNFHINGTEDLIREIQTVSLAVSENMETDTFTMTDVTNSLLRVYGTLSCGGSLTVSGGGTWASVPVHALQVAGPYSLCSGVCDGAPLPFQSSAYMTGFADSGSNIAQESSLESLSIKFVQQDVTSICDRTAVSCLPPAAYDHSWASQGIGFSPSFQMAHYLAGAPGPSASPDWYWSLQENGVWQGPCPVGEDPADSTWAGLEQYKYFNSPQFVRNWEAGGWRVFGLRSALWAGAGFAREVSISGGTFVTSACVNNKTTQRLECAMLRVPPLSPCVGTSGPFVAPPNSGVAISGGLRLGGRLEVVGDMRVTGTVTVGTSTLELTGSRILMSNENTFVASFCTNMNSQWEHAFSPDFQTLPFGTILALPHLILFAGDQEARVEADISVLTDMTISGDLLNAGTVTASSITAAELDATSLVSLRNLPDGFSASHLTSLTIGGTLDTLVSVTSDVTFTTLEVDHFSLATGTFCWGDKKMLHPGGLVNFLSAC